MKPTKKDNQIFDILSEGLHTDELGLVEVDIKGKRAFCIVLILEEKKGTELVPLSVIVNEELMNTVTMIDDVKLLKLNKASTNKSLFGDEISNILNQN